MHVCTRVLNTKPHWPELALSVWWKHEYYKTKLLIYCRDVWINTSAGLRNHAYVILACPFYDQSVDISVICGERLTSGLSIWLYDWKPFKSRFHVTSGLTRCGQRQWLQTTVVRECAACLVHFGSLYRTRKRCLQLDPALYIANQAVWKRFALSSVLTAGVNTTNLNLFSAHNAIAFLSDRTRNHLSTEMWHHSNLDRSARRYYSFLQFCCWFFFAFTRTHVRM